MTKNKLWDIWKRSKNWVYGGGIVIILGTVASIAVARYKNESEHESLREEIFNLNAQGSKVSQKNSTTIEVINTKIDATQRDINDMKCDVRQIRAILENTVVFEDKPNPKGWN